MTIEELKIAYTNGETIQFRLDGKGWTDWENPKFDCEPEDYRIKPKYRPFNDCGELIATWQKMMGYPAKANTMPLIWVKDSFGRICNICGFDNKNGYVFLLADKGKTFSEMFEQYTFLDNTSFGVAE